MKASIYPTLPGHNVLVSPDDKDGQFLTCPFCLTKIYSVFADHKVTKEFMGKHLAKQHKSDMERVLRKIDNIREIHNSLDKATGFKKGL